MKFVSIRRLSAHFKLEFSSIDDKLLKELRKLSDDHFIKNDVLTAFNQSFTQNEINFCLNSLNNKNNRTFYTWIENDKVLLRYLMNQGKVSTDVKEVLIPKEKKQLSLYQHFLSPYLKPIVKERLSSCLNKNKISELVYHLEISRFLPKKEAIEIQSATALFLSNKITQAKFSYGRDLKELLYFIYSYDFVNSLNSLDHHFYAQKLAYFNTAKLMVQKGEISLLKFEDLKSTLVSLELEEKDHEQLNTFLVDKTPEILRKPEKSTFNQMIRSPLFFVALIVVLINLILFFW